MTDSAPFPYTAEYIVKDANVFHERLRELPEFVGGHRGGEADHLIWMPPVWPGHNREALPVAALHISGNTVTVKCLNLQAHRAMRVLIEGYCTRRDALSQVQSGD